MAANFHFHFLRNSLPMTGRLFVILGLSNCPAGGVVERRKRGAALKSMSDAMLSQNRQDTSPQEYDPLIRYYSSCEVPGVTRDIRSRFKSYLQARSQY